VLASVDEADIVKVALNQKVIITADAIPNRQFAGKVVRIATKGTDVSNVVTFEVKIELTGDTEDLLKPEMTVNVQVISVEHGEAMLVPANAIIRENGKDFITIVKPGGAREKRTVQTGLTDEDNVEVLGGVSLDEKVVIQNEQPSKFSNEKADRPERSDSKGDASKSDSKKSGK
jgi:multidrug efflux pump subunit AcrA (membrane-fusion protein)